VHLLEGLDTLIVQDMFLTKTAELADVVFPAANSAFETDGTVTNSERRVQRVRKALDPPGDAHDDIWIIAQMAKRLGVDWGEVTSEQAWDELRSLSRMHTLMSWQRIEELGGIQWPCNEEFPDGAKFLHGRLWAFDDPEKQGPKAPFSVVIDIPPADTLTRSSRCA
jgi:formate dehydrogenase major subunit